MRRRAFLASLVALAAGVLWPAKARGPAYPRAWQVGVYHARPSSVGLWARVRCNKGEDLPSSVEALEGIRRGGDFDPWLKGRRVQSSVAIYDSFDPTEVRFDWTLVG